MEPSFHYSTSLQGIVLNGTQIRVRFAFTNEKENRALNGLYSLSKDSRYLITTTTQYTNQHTDTANVLTAELLQHKAYKLQGWGVGEWKTEGECVMNE